MLAFQIRNVVCNYTLPLHIDLRKLALNSNNVTFDRGRGVSFRFFCLMCSFSLEFFAVVLFKLASCFDFLILRFRLIRIFFFEAGQPTLTPIQANSG